MVWNDGITTWNNHIASWYNAFCSCKTSGLNRVFVSILISQDLWVRHRAVLRFWYMFPLVVDTHWYTPFGDSSRSTVQLFCQPLVTLPLLCQNNINSVNVLTHRTQFWYLWCQSYCFLLKDSNFISVFLKRKLILLQFFSLFSR